MNYPQQDWGILWYLLWRRVIEKMMLETKRRNISKQMMGIVLVRIQVPIAIVVLKTTQTHKKNIFPINIIPFTFLRLCITSDYCSTRSLSGDDDNENDDAKGSSCEIIWYFKLDTNGSLSWIFCFLSMFSFLIGSSIDNFRGATDTRQESIMSLQLHLRLVSWGHF